MANSIHLPGIFIALASMLFGTDARAAPPPVDQSEPKPVPGHPIVIRDSWGVPHIYAAKESDGFYALGYAQSEDNLIGILTSYAASQGRLAEVEGSAALDSDRVARLWKHSERAKQAFAELPADLRANYVAFAAGIRKYMHSHATSVPEWAQPPTGWEPIALFRWGIWAPFDSYDGYKTCERAGALDKSSLAAAISTDSTHAPASNEWIFGPDHTASGALIHMLDPHAVFGGLIGVWEFRMHAPGYEVAGFTLSGLATTPLGHSREIAMAMTTGGPRTSDCYYMPLADGDPKTYVRDGHTERVIEEQVTLAVKGEASRSETLEYMPLNGQLAPVVGRKQQRLYVVTTSYEHSAAALDEEIYALWKSHNVREAAQALKLQGIYPQNLLIGDAHGGALYARVGRTPIRNPKIDISEPIPASIEMEWRGLHPSDDLVLILEPKAEVLSNSNVAPDTVDGGFRDAASAAVDADKFPADVFNDLPGRLNTRGRRFWQVARMAPKISAAQALDLALDEQWWGTDLWQKSLRSAASRASACGTHERPAVKRLATLLGFDGKARKESVPATEWLAWRLAIGLIAERSAGGEAALREAVEDGESLTCDQDVILLDAIRRIPEILRKLGVTSPVPLGALCDVGRGSVALPIGGETIRVGDGTGAPSVLDTKDVVTLRAIGCSTHLMIGSKAGYGQRDPMLTIFTNPIQSFSSVPFGNSYQLNSSHYSDQSRLMSDRKLKPVWFEWEQLRDHIETRYEVPLADALE